MQLIVKNDNGVILYSNKTIAEEFIQRNTFKGFKDFMRGLKIMVKKTDL